MKNLLALFALFIFLFTPPAFSATPQSINYQGVLTNAAAIPIDTTVNIEIRLFDAALSGTQLYSESHAGTVVDEGVFALSLGAGSSATGTFDATTFANNTIWLEIVVEGEAQTPRQAFLSVPYALHAEDADLVDGLHANEIIDAAADEVRTPIDSLPFTISTSGSYYLTGNLTNSTGIDVTVDNVTIDLMGFTLSGDGSTAAHGIDMSGRANVTVRNGSIRAFGNAGIYAFSSNYARVLHVRVIGNGTTTGDNGIHLGTNAHIEGCLAADSGGSGIVTSSGSVIIDNTISNNGFQGIKTGFSTIAGNSIHDNTNRGIDTYASNVTENVIYNNGNDGMWVSTDSTVISNTVYSNQNHGINSSVGTLIRNNTVNNNNTNDSVFGSGIRTGGRSQIIGNTVYANSQNGIRVDGNGSAIEENMIVHYTNVGNGIDFNDTGNFYANNRASGYAVDYAGDVPIGSGDGGGNASF